MTPDLHGLQTHTAVINGDPAVLIADIAGGPITTITGTPIGPLLTRAVCDTLVCARLGDALDLAGIVSRERVFAAAIDRSKRAGHRHKGRLDSQQRQRDRDDLIISSMGDAIVTVTAGHNIRDGHRAFVVSQS